MNFVRAGLFSAVAVVAFICSGCGMVTKSHAGLVPLRGSLAAVAVAGDTPAEVRHNVAAAKAAGKDVRFVTVTSHGTSDIYSPYAQIVRSDEGLIARAYGRVHVYRLNGAKVTYPEGIPVSVDTLPKVNAVTIDAALRSPGHAGVAEARRLRLCEHCDAVFLRANSDVPVQNPWPSARDPWQIAPDYAFWKPENVTRSPLTAVDPACYVYFDTSCRSGGVGPDQFCPPIYNGCAYYPRPTPTPDACSCAVLNPSAIRRAPEAERKSIDAINKLHRAIEAHTIADAEIEANIDPGITGHTRDLARAAMEKLPPFARQHVAGTAPDGTFFANRTEDYQAHLHAGKWRQISERVWENPDGEIITVPDFWGGEKAQASAKHALSISCPAPISQNTGGYVRGYLCDSTSSSYTATVDATRVGGFRGSSWCLGYAETGYLLVGAWSNGTGKSGEAGLQWSEARKLYVIFALDEIGGIAPDVPSTYAYPPGPFTLAFTILQDQWAITVSSQSTTNTYFYNKAEPVEAGPSWTYKQGTMIAQRYYNVTDGSFFGTDSASGQPLFYWSGAPAHDYWPDPTRGVRIGELYGVNLHS
jgi:hypothetical protein